MARNPKKFDWLKSEAMNKIETIYEQGQTTQQPASHPSATGTVSEPSVPATAAAPQQQVAEAQQSVPTQQPFGVMPQQPTQPSHPVCQTLDMKPLKTEKGVKVTLPMDYYFRLARLKECTGKTLQELAAQGVMEFIDRYSQG